MKIVSLFGTTHDEDDRGRDWIEFEFHVDEPLDHLQADLVSRVRPPANLDIHLRAYLDHLWVKVQPVQIEWAMDWLLSAEVFEVATARAREIEEMRLAAHEQAKKAIEETSWE